MALDAITKVLRKHHRIWGVDSKLSVFSYQCSVISVQLLVFSYQLSVVRNSLQITDN